MKYHYGLGNKGFTSGIMWPSKHDCIRAYNSAFRTSYVTKCDRMGHRGNPNLSIRKVGFSNKDNHRFIDKGIRLRCVRTLFW